MHEPAPEWTSQLALNHSVLLAEMAGLVPGADKTMDIDMWFEHMRENLLRLLHVDVPRALILSVMSPVVPFHAEPTPATALHLLRSGLCCKLVGIAMAAQAHRLILAEVADVPVGLLSSDEVALKVRQELVGTLHRQLCGSSDIEDPEDIARPAKRSRTKAAM